jgi:hypothetical protein
VGWREKKEREKKRKDKKMKGKERNKIGEKKNGLSSILEIVIDNLSLLYYYWVMEIEDVNYTMK